MTKVTIFGKLFSNYFPIVYYFFTNFFPTIRGSSGEHPEVIRGSSGGQKGVPLGFSKLKKQKIPGPDSSYHPGDIAVKSLGL